MWWKRLLEAFAAWRSRRAAINSIPVPCFIEMRMEEARRAVKLEREKQKLIEETAATEKAKREAGHETREG